MRTEEDFELSAETLCSPLGSRRGMKIVMWLVVCSLVDQVLAGLDRQHQNMRITVTRPLGSCAVMQVSVKEVVTGCLLWFVPESLI